MDPELMAGFHLRLRLLRNPAALGLVIVCLLSAMTKVIASADDSLTWHVANNVDGADGAASRWYRFVCRHDLAGADVRLTVAAEGTLTGYVNGQRLIRQRPMAAQNGSVQALAFDVGAVLRNGRNCVALELRTDKSTSVLAASLVQMRDGLPEKSIDGEWRFTETVPPVGWQQTDFNAGDWQVTSGLAEAPADSFAVVPAASVTAVVTTTAADRSPFEFLEGDHVVLLGATFIERAQPFGHLETALSAAVPQLKVTFRNLGWDGDTVFADSRGIFDAPEVGYLRMIEQVRAEEPTVVIVCYGQNEALDAGLTPAQFESQLGRLLDDLSTTGACRVLMTPHPLLPAVRPLPDPSRYNSRIQQNAGVVQRVASARTLTVVDLWTGFTEELNDAGRRLSSSPTDAISAGNLVDHPDLQSVSAARWSDNGMHWNDRGYEAVSMIVRHRLLTSPVSGCRLRVVPAAEQLQIEGGEVRNVRWNGEPNTLLTFQLKEPCVCSVPAIIRIDTAESAMGWSGTVASASSRSVQTLIPSQDDDETLLLPVSAQYTALKNAVIRKNELYFHRWRPQNITYLFGFRKHEQGNNAVEIAQFDPFVKELEEQIHRLKQPEWRTVVITRR